MSAIRGKYRHKILNLMSSRSEGFRNIVWKRYIMENLQLKLLVPKRYALRCVIKCINITNVYNDIFQIVQVFKKKMSVVNHSCIDLRLKLFIQCFQNSTYFTICMANRFRTKKMEARWYLMQINSHSCYLYKYNIFLTIYVLTYFRTQQISFFADLLRKNKNLTQLIFRFTIFHVTSIFSSVSRIAYSMYSCFQKRIILSTINMTKQKIGWYFDIINDLCVSEY